MAVTTEQRAKLVRNGHGQAVSLPKEFEFAGDEVRIRRVGEGVVLEPVVRVEEKPDWSWMEKVREGLDASFFEGLGKEQDPQKRPELDKLFR